MKLKIKKNSKNIKIAYKNKGKFKNFYSTLNNNRINYKPEFRINKTINQYIKSKLNSQDKKLENNSNNSTVKSAKNRKYLIPNENEYKVKPFNYNNRQHSENNIMKNGGNYEEINNTIYNSINKIFNFSKTENSNDLKSYSDRNSYNNKTINGHLNNYSMNPLNNNKNIIINSSKRHLVSKINPKINNNFLRNQNVFNNDYFNNENDYNHKSYNNNLDGNEIYSAIKNLKNYKNIKKDSYINYNKQKSQDKEINSSLNGKTFQKEINKKNEHKKQNLKSCKNNIYSFKKKDVENKKNIIKIQNKEIENGLNRRDGKNIINDIIKEIFRNADKIEKKLQYKNESKKRLYSPLLSKYKKDNVIINNNTSIIKYNYFNKEKYFFEYKNQIVSK